MFETPAPAVLAPAPPVIVPLLVKVVSELTVITPAPAIWPEPPEIFPLLVRAPSVPLLPTPAPPPVRKVPPNPPEIVPLLVSVVTVPLFWTPKPPYSALKALPPEMVAPTALVSNPIESPLLTATPVPARTSRSAPWPPLIAPLLLRVVIEQFEAETAVVPVGAMILPVTETEIEPPLASTVP
jgi:hypothetical protein